MIKYAKLKKDIVLLNYKYATNIADERLIAPEGTIVEVTSAFTKGRSHIWIEYYCNICDKTDLEFLE